MNKLYLTDYHLHSHFSPDSTSALEEICEQAVRMGLSEIAVTDHAELRPSQPDELDFFAAHQAIHEIAMRYAGRLAVRHGVELGQPMDNPSLATRYYEPGTVDFIIGSIHLMQDGSDPYLEDYSSFDPVQYYARYLDRLMEYVRNWDFDVLGHLTYPLRYMHKQLGKIIDLSLFEARFRELFGMLVERGHGIEINVSGYRQSIGEPFPSAQVLRLYHACGGELITVGSDAHTARDVGAGVREGVGLLQEIGFQYIATFENRKAIMHTI